MTVTDLKPRRHRLTALFLDGEPVTVDTETLTLEGIQVGDTLSEEDLAQLLSKSQGNRAYEKALYLLEYRAHSRAELVQKISREYPKEVAEEAVERVSRLGLVDDQAFARDYARELFTVKKFGKVRVRQELARKGIDRDLIDTVLADYENDPTDDIEQLIRKKYKQVPTDKKDLQKVIAAMMRRGFAYSDIRRALLNLAEHLEY